MNAATTVLIVPGLRDHVAEHWQTLLAQELQATGVPVVTVPPLRENKLSLAARVAAIQQEICALPGPFVVIAHSGGVPMLMHWLQRHYPATAAGQIRGALLATPPDFEQPLPAGYPTLDELRANGWLPVPTQRLPFRSLVAASSNDPLASLPAVERMSASWGSELVSLGAVGHLNPASGYGPWPQARALVQQLID